MDKIFYREVLLFALSTAPDLLPWTFYKDHPLDVV